jgi:hypothetical protein
MANSELQIGKIVAGTGVPAKFAAPVTSASEGAVTDKD